VKQGFEKPDLKKEDPQPLRNGEDDLATRHGQQKRLHFLKWFYLIF